MMNGVAERPIHFTGSYQDYTPADIEWVAQNFRIEGPVRVGEFPGKGNINLHTYEVDAKGRRYLLQKVNSDVFSQPHRVMKGMTASIDAQTRALASTAIQLDWTPIELIRTQLGEAYLDLTDEHGWSVWRLMVRIPDSKSYKSLGEIEDRSEQLSLAREVGRGLAIYTDLTSAIDSAGVDGSLPGYRDTDLYYRQFESVVAGSTDVSSAHDFLPTDNTLRQATESLFYISTSPQIAKSRREDPDLAPYIDLVTKQKPFAMGLWNALRAGTVRRTLIHGDTKLENFLFCPERGNVKSLVDLDTIMPFTWLADWGDMLRSLVNVAGEKETDIRKVVVDEAVFEAVAEGFLAESSEATDAEVALMASAVPIIALELGMRFLTDYLRGDNYFALGPRDPSDLNKTRAMVQLALHQRLVAFMPKAEEMIRRLRAANA